MSPLKRPLRGHQDSFHWALLAWGDIRKKQKIEDFGTSWQPPKSEILWSSPYATHSEWEWLMGPRTWPLEGIRCRLECVFVGWGRGWGWGWDWGRGLGWSIWRYYASGAMILMHLVLLCLFQMDFVISWWFSAYYSCVSLPVTYFALTFTVFSAHRVKKALVFLL